MEYEILKEDYNFLDLLNSEISYDAKCFVIKKTMGARVETKMTVSFNYHSFIFSRLIENEEVLNWFIDNDYIKEQPLKCPVCNVVHGITGNGDGFRVHSDPNKKCPLLHALFGQKSEAVEAYKRLCKLTQKGDS
jgi:hypothetical protein